jgi:MYXO-CTERM domain-containing protein
VAAYASDPEASSQLAFAGVGNGFWSTSMGGLGLVLLGAYFVVRRRPRTTATPSYRSLVKDF